MRGRRKPLRINDLRHNITPRRFRPLQFERLAILTCLPIFPQLPHQGNWYYIEFYLEIFGASWFFPLTIATIFSSRPLSFTRAANGSCLAIMFLVNIKWMFIFAQSFLAISLQLNQSRPSHNQHRQKFYTDN